MPERPVLRRAAAALLPVAGLAAGFACDALLPALVIAAAFAIAYLVTIPDRAGRPLSLSAMVALAALVVHDGSPTAVLTGAAIGPPGTSACWI